MADSINVKQGESKVLTFLLEGDLTSDHTRIYLSKDNGVKLEKFSTDAGDAGYTLFDSYTYDSSTGKTTFLANQEASETAAYPVGTHNVSVWTKRTQAGFSEGFVRLTKIADGLVVSAFTS